MTLLFAFLLDLLLGDPERMPHPVRWIGRLINKLENSLFLEKGEGRSLSVIPAKAGIHFKLFGIKMLKMDSRLRGDDNKLRGIILVIIVCSITYLITFAIVIAAGFVHPLFGLCVEIFLIYLTLSVKSLGSSAMEILHHLKQNDLNSARKSVSKIVGRDTENMNEEEVVRASVETVAENTVDGIISPLFFAFLGGAPLAMMFKAVSTLDSMVGYKNERYQEFGWASARLDDVLNWIPARTCFFLVPIAAWFLKMKAPESFNIALRDGKKHASPNSGIAESAFAGAMGIQLGGTNFRQGTPVEYPALGDSLKPIEINDISAAVRLSWTVSWIYLLAIVLTSLLISQNVHFIS